MEVGLFPIKREGWRPWEEGPQTVQLFPARGEQATEDTVELRIFCFRHFSLFENYSKSRTVPSDFQV